MNGCTVTLQKVGEKIRFTIQDTLYVDCFIRILHIDSIDAGMSFWLQYRSAFCVPCSVFRVPCSAFRVPRFVFRILRSVFYVLYSLILALGSWLYALGSMLYADE